MKKNIFNLLFLSVFSLININELQAENNLDSVALQIEKVEISDDFFNKKRTIDFAEIPYANIVKINFSSLIFSNIGLQYERILTNKVSVALGLRFMPKGKLPFRSTVMSFVEYNESSQESEEGLADFFNNTRVGGFAITPEFRYYFRKAGKGMYIAPYFRYGQYGITSVYNYVDKDKGHDITINFKGSYTNIGGGLMLGSQFNLGSRVTLDWWILGPFIGTMKFNLEASGYTLTNDEYEAIKEDFDAFDIDFAGYKLEKNLTHSSADLSIKGLSAAFRGLGLTLGVKL